MSEKNVEVEVFPIKVNLQSELEKVLNEIGATTADSIAWRAPLGYTGEYADSWTHTLLKSGKTVIVHSKPTHDTTNMSYFLEKGHLSRGNTWVPAQPHVRPAYNAAKKEFISKLKNMDLKVDAETKIVDKSKYNKRRGKKK